TGSASGSRTARCCASATSRCTARSSCRAWPTCSIASASSSTCGSACARSICCAASAPSSCTAASCAAPTKSRSSSGGAPPSGLRLFRRLVFGFLLERLPDGLEADEPLFVRRHRARRHEARTSVGNLGLLGLLLAHVSPLLAVKPGRHPQAL